MEWKEWKVFKFVFKFLISQVSVSFVGQCIHIILILRFPINKVHVKKSLTAKECYSLQYYINDSDV